MRQALRRHTRLVGSALLCVFVVLFSVTCMARAEMTDAQKACCAQMVAGCGAAMGQEHDCCPTESAQLDQQFAATARVVISPPAQASVVLTSPDYDGVPHAVLNVLDRSDSSPPFARGVPPYLLLSNLRI